MNDTRQRLAFITSGGVWTCAWCAAELANGAITHRDDCRWIAEIAAAERQRIRRRIGLLPEPIGGEHFKAGWQAALAKFADLLGGDPV